MSIDGRPRVSCARTRHDARREWLEGALALALADSHHPARPSAQGAAEQTLRAALEAWKSGEPAPALVERRPPIYAFDHEWHAGHKLVGYEIDGETEPLGPDLRCAARLWLQDPRAEHVQKQAIYTVATHPVHRVVREEAQPQWRPLA